MIAWAEVGPIRLARRPTLVMTPRIRVLIADDHPAMRMAIRELLRADPDVEVVSEAVDAEAAVAECRRIKPEVVIMDLNMPGGGGLRAAKEIQASLPGTKILVLTFQEDVHYVRQAQHAGAAGFVAKREIFEELKTAIHKVYQGKAHFPGKPMAGASAPARLN